MSKSIPEVKDPCRFQILKEDGLSLIEVAIALVIIGMLSVPLMTLYRIEAADRLHGQTNGRVNNTSDAITNFFISGNNHYPCPASLSAALNDNDFGKQVPECALDMDISDIDRCTNPSWVGLGICKTSDNPATAVIFGAVPFTDLKLSQGQELDAWGNKLIYAVGFNQTNTATFDDGNVIVPLSVDAPSDPTADGIPDQLMDSSTTPPTPKFYQYMILSTGSNALGGFTKDGNRITDCTNPSNEMSELENCDFDETFLLRTDPDIQGASAVSDTVLYYDDYTFGLSSMSTPLWHENTNAATDEVAMTTATHVGIGTQDPDAALHVSDKTQADANLLIEHQVDENGLPILDAFGNLIGGKLKTDDVCSVVVTTTPPGETPVCFNPKIIADNVAEMECDTLVEAVNELSDSRVKCSTVEDANGNKIGDGNPLSTNGTFSGECLENVNGNNIKRPAIGFDSSGGILCN